MRDVDKSTACYLKARGPFTWTLQGEARMDDGTKVLHQCDTCGGRYSVVAYGLMDDGDVGARICIANAGCLESVTDGNFAAKMRFEKVTGVKYVPPSEDDLPGLDFTVENPDGIAEPTYATWITKANTFKRCGFGRRWHKLIGAILKKFGRDDPLTNLEVETLRRYCDVCGKEKKACL